MNALTLTLLGLAAYRSAALLVDDEIPFGGFREWLLERRPALPWHDDLNVEHPGSLFSYLWTCMSCMSVWTTAAWWTAWWIWPTPTLTLAGPFAVAGLARAAAALGKP